MHMSPIFARLIRYYRPRISLNLNRCTTAAMCPLSIRLNAIISLGISRDGDNAESEHKGHEQGDNFLCHKIYILSLSDAST